MLRFLDFVIVMAVLMGVSFWVDNTAHRWILFFGVMAANLVGFARGIARR